MSWMTAVVIPILKPDKNSALAESYRPLSLLPVLSKLAEKVILARLNDHLERENILIPEQHGFRPRVSPPHINFSESFNLLRKETTKMNARPRSSLIFKKPLIDRHNGLQESLQLPGRDYGFLSSFSRSLYVFKDSETGAHINSIKVSWRAMKNICIEAAGVKRKLVASDVENLNRQCAKRTRAESQCCVIYWVKFLKRRVARRSVYNRTIINLGKYNRLIYSEQRCSIRNPREVFDRTFRKLRGFSHFFRSCKICGRKVSRWSNITPRNRTSVTTRICVSRVHIEGSGEEPVCDKSERSNFYWKIYCGRSHCTT
ncbi:hypothetical protein TNCV_4091901 [Trichonephila clavipes]|nr:hypothetical protein TNCV_4091901 [Trichonephila clavipes]